MWHTLSVQLSLALGQPFEVEEKMPIDGGDINECYSIANGDTRFFVKVNSKIVCRFMRQKRRACATLPTAEKSRCRKWYI